MQNQEYEFDSKVKLLKKFEANDADVKNEPMFFNASFDFAYKNAGPITKSFLDNLPDNWESGVFDSRVHMLMKDWFPAIPGYHHDDIPRSTKSGQPNYDNPEYHSEHIMGLVNGDICPTEFALGKAKYSHVPNDEVVYKVWHKETCKHLQNNKLELFKAPDRTLIFFDAHTWHQATNAVESGWRWFGRISRNTDRTIKVTNEIRRQVQVYMNNPMQGW